MERSERPGGSGGEAPEAAAEWALHASNRLLRALTEVQTEFIQNRVVRGVFDKLLTVLLELTGSEYGFIGEAAATADGAPYLRTRAITNIAWTDELRALYDREAPRGFVGVEFRNLHNLFGAVLVTGQMVMTNAADKDPRRGGLPPGHPPLRAFLGLPFHSATELVGMVGLANRPGGYDADVVAFLQPVLTTCCAILLGLRSEARREQAEAEQRRSAESFRALIEGSPEAIFVHREGRLLFTNSAAVRLLGHADSASLERRPLTDFVQPEDAELLGESSKDEGPREVRFRHRLDLRVLGEVSTVSLVFDGQPALVSTARDITGRRQEQEQLRATERMVSLGTLAAGVAHEINNPLSYLLSNLRFVDEELTSMRETGEGLAGERGREVREALQEALAGSHRVRDIVRDLKTFSRDGEDQLAQVDVRGVLDSCVNMAWSEIRHRARLEKDYGEVPLLEANASRLGQIFLNLLVNAAHAIAHGNRDGNSIHVSTRHEEGLVVVAIRDSGVGIPEEHLSKLFSPFFTTKPVGEGTGLGLSICHNLIMTMGGRITVDSHVGKGTTFRVFLPVKRPSGIAR
ncbi:ATP-binding protein [Melittangium boletus]|uniref:histidine kinase n=1 Tax=Melittangium boletus DSM 14713 TaxID=1294270 RepID=A0A250IRJ3_9BACT|nr:ATP-binding protein [Melittangium boletus]ATB33556.1 hypothetical protein MEBOL_007054 [Melittangium boletus DSM 14713]